MIAGKFAILDTLIAGKVVQGKYEIVDLLGFGPWYVLYRAKDLSNPADEDGGVALKLPRTFNDSAEEIKAVEMLLKEIESLERLQAAETALNEDENTTIISTPTYYGSSTEPPERFLALEFMRGRQVSALLAETEPYGLKEAVALNIATQLFRLLDLLHTRLLVTCNDLKLENFWWTEIDSQSGEGLLKITDWNELASLEGKSEAEQAQAIESDLFRALLYLYRMVTGTLPNLVGNNTATRLEQAQNWGLVSRETQELLNAALARKQYPSAGELQRDTRRLLDAWQCADKAGHALPSESAPETLPATIAERAIQGGQMTEAPRELEAWLSQARQNVQANQFSQAAANYRQALSLAEKPHEVFDEIIRIARHLEQEERHDELLTLTQYTGALGLFGDVKEMRHRALAAREMQRIGAAKKQWQEAADLEAEKIRLAEQRKREAAELQAETERQKDAMQCLDEMRKASTLAASPEKWALMVQKARLLQSYPQYPEPHREALLLFMQFFRAVGPQLNETHLKEFEELLPHFPVTVAKQVQNARTQAEAVRRTWKEREETAQQRIAYEQALEQKAQLLARLKEGNLVKALEIARQLPEEMVDASGEIPGLLASLKPNVEKIIEAGMAEEFELVFAHWLKPTSQRSFENDLRNIHASQLNEWFEPAREALQQGDGLAALKKMEMLLLEHPLPTAGLETSWLGHWRGVLNPLIQLLSTDARLEAARLRALLSQLAFEARERTELSNAIELASQRQKHNLNLTEGNQRTEALLRLLQDEQYSQAADYAEAWLGAAPEINPDQSALIATALYGAQKLAEGEDTNLLEHYLATLGRLVRVEGFGSAHRARFWQRRKSALEQKFTELRQAMQTEPQEQVLSKMQTLLGTGEAPAAALKGPWLAGWQQVITQALTVNWKDQAATEKQLALIINRVWTTTEESQVLADAVARAHAEHKKASEAIHLEFERSYLMRLTDLDIQAGNTIHQKRQSKELTLGLYRMLVRQIKELLPATPSSDPAIQRVQKVTAEKLAMLQEAEGLWSRARRSKDPVEKLKIVEELLGRGFYGWKLPGDFEQELGVQVAEVKREVQRAAEEEARRVLRQRAMGESQHKAAQTPTGAAPRETPPTAVGETWLATPPRSTGATPREAPPTPVGGTQREGLQTPTGQTPPVAPPTEEAPAPGAEGKISVTFRQLKNLREMQWVYPLRCAKEIQNLLDQGLDEASQRDLEKIQSDYQAQDPKLLEKLEQAARENLDDINYGINLQKLCAGVKGLPRYDDIVDSRRWLQRKNAPPMRFG